MAGLNLVELQLDLPALLRTSPTKPRERHLDLGYHVHGWLTQTVGARVLQPFTLREAGSSRGMVHLLAYSVLDAAGVEDAASRFGTPSQLEAIRRAASKRMPTLSPGTRLDIEVRVVPTVRLRTPLIPDGATKPVKKGGELCAWRTRVARGEDVDVGTAYRDWFESRVPATIERFEIRQRRRVRMLRRGTGRKGTTFDLPEATFSATLTTHEGFMETLATGVGRHRAFGFGMLLLRPPGC